MPVPQTILTLCQLDMGQKGVGLAQLQYYLYSIRLFTLSDLKTIVIPSTAFGLLHSLALSELGTLPVETGVSVDDAPTLLSRLPLVALWAWINLLPFAIDNQRQPAAIQEDASNKPGARCPRDGCDLTRPRR